MNAENFKNSNHVKAIELQVFARWYVFWWAKRRP